MTGNGTGPGAAATVTAVLEAARHDLNDLLGARTPLIVLLSGGQDSVCLLDVLVTLCGSARTRALHVDYGLRPGAADDRRHCAALCARLSVSLEVLTARRPQHAAGNLQAWARDVRYGAAVQRALAAGAVVVSGHTASDQVETALYRLAASPGRRALLGMTSREGLLARPLLTVTREQTADYCRARGLTWRADPSNDSDRFARGRVRRAVVPALRSVHPAAEANVRATIALLRDEGLVLDEVVTTALAGRDRIAVAHLAALPPALARLVVVRLAEQAGEHLLPSAGARVGELLALGQRGGSAALDLGGGVRAVVEYGVLRMTAETEDPPPPAVTLAVPGRVSFGRWELESRVEEASLGHPLAAAVVPDVELLDAAALNGELWVRTWRAGDRMQPRGLGATKTLSDLFGQRRVPRAQRRTMPVVEIEGQIAWVPGIAVGQRFAVTAATAVAVRMRAHRGPAFPLPPGPQGSELGLP